MSDPIVCKPTPWFLWRAGAMLLMFGIFAVMFVVDGRTGYREKNFSYYVWQTVVKASEDFAARQSSDTPESWRAYAGSQQIAFPEDRGVLPERVQVPMPWPEKLGDYEFMKAGQANQKELLFKPLMEDVGLKKSAPKQAFDARKIGEQWFFGGVFGVLAVGSLVVLLRTMGRRLALEDGVLRVPGSKPAPLSDLVRLDLRKWSSKGLAYAWAKAGDGGERKLRIDGLTYGGFKHDDGEPAERLMEAVREGFSGEIVEYAEEETDEPGEQEKDR